MAKRVVVFIDAQNAYRCAREVFFSPSALGGVPVAHAYGQYRPVALAQLIASRGDGSGQPYTLEEVRVYTGRPDASRDSKSYSAHMKQCASWHAAGATVVPRALRYPYGYPAVRAQEKGIDVALAIDFVAGALDGQYDVGVIVSTDTDLVPALEFVHNRFAGTCTVAVAAWRHGHSRRRLAIQSGNVWCYWLDRRDYDACADITSYSH